MATVDIASWIAIGMAIGTFLSMIIDIAVTRVKKKQMYRSSGVRAWLEYSSQTGLPFITLDPDLKTTEHDIKYVRQWLEDWRLAQSIKEIENE